MGEFRDRAADRFITWLERYRPLAVVVGVWLGTAFLVGLGQLLYDLIDAVGIIFGWWSGGPDGLELWYGLGGLALVVITVVQLNSSNDEEANREFWRTARAGLGVIALGILTLARWSGWKATELIVLAAVVGVPVLVVVIDYWVARRKRQSPAATPVSAEPVRRPDDGDPDSTSRTHDPYRLGVGGDPAAAGAAFAQPLADQRRAAVNPVGSAALRVPAQAQARATGLIDGAPDPTQAAAPASPRSSTAQRQATLADRRAAAGRGRRKDFEHPIVAWIITLLSWAVGTLWLHDQGLLTASWLPHGLFWYLLLLVAPPSLAIFPLSRRTSMPVRRMRAWFGVGSALALGPGLVVGPLTGLIVGSGWALLHKGGFWSGFVHGAATYGAGLVLGVQLAASVAALITLVTRFVVAVALWMIISVVTFGTVFGHHLGLIWGIVAAVCGAIFVVGTFEVVREEMPDS